LIDRGELRNPMVAPLARTFLRAKWSFLSPIMGNPAQVRELVRAHDWRKGQLLDTVEGYTWLEWTLYRVKSYLAWFARVKHADRIRPPASQCPLKLVTPALEAGE
ncbi:MAG: hypothetical protein ACREB9_02225, partial [Thermoplasmata archaeon]